MFYCFTVKTLCKYIKFGFIIGFPTYSKLAFYTPAHFRHAHVKVPECNAYYLVTSPNETNFWSELISLVSAMLFVHIQIQMLCLCIAIYSLFLCCILFSFFLGFWLCVCLLHLGITFSDHEIHWWHLSNERTELKPFVHSFLSKNYEYIYFIQNSTPTLSIWINEVKVYSLYENEMYSTQIIELYYSLFFPSFFLWKKRNWIVCQFCVFLCSFNGRNPDRFRLKLA